MTPSYKKKGNMKIYLCLLIHSERNTQKISQKLLSLAKQEEEEEMGK